MNIADLSGNKVILNYSNAVARLQPEIAIRADKFARCSLFPANLEFVCAWPRHKGPIYEFAAFGAVKNQLWVYWRRNQSWRSYRVDVESWDYAKEAQEALESGSFWGPSAESALDLVECAAWREATAVALNAKKWQWFVAPFLALQA